MIELKEAVEKAKALINEIEDQPDGLQVEEAFISTDETYWAVGISYLRKSKKEYQSEGVSTRALKMVHVNGESGKVTGLYNQESES